MIKEGGEALRRVGVSRGSGIVGEDFGVVEELVRERGGDISGERLCDYDLSNLVFEGVVMRGVRLLSVDMGGVEFRRCDLSGSVILAVSLCGRGPSFYDCDLRGSVISVESWGRVISFRGCDLSGSVFVDSEVVGVDFEGALCVGTDFRGMVYDFSGAESLCLSGYIEDIRMRFRGSDLRGARFDGVVLCSGDFEWADLEGVSFRGCDFSGSDVLGEGCFSVVSFRGALLAGVDWEGAKVGSVIYN